ncbi:MAG: nucleoside recognition protein [Bacteroidales bacterium]|nr:nucleoside recognition protein [Bacteroidales bacterium]
MASVRDSIKEILPSTTKTCWWIVKLTVGVSAAMMLLKYFGILPIIADFVQPVFKWFGLPGDASLAYVSGYFVNVYSALAVIGTLDLTVRQITILGTMVLCSHSMILETAVIKKTGVSGTAIVIVRTLSAILLGVILNRILPPEDGSLIAASAAETTQQEFLPVFLEWLKSTLKLVVMMVAIIYSLNILQKLLKDFGIMEKISRFLRPVMMFFGLPPKTAFLWIVANLIGLGYGAAAMLDEIEHGSLQKDDIVLIDTHICVSHSNLEDLLLVTAMGAVWYVMLLSRWALSFLLVWAVRLKKRVFGSR